MKRTSLLFAAAFVAGWLPIHRADGGESAMTAPIVSADSEYPAEPAIKPGSVKLSRREIGQLVTPRPGAIVNFPSIDRFTGNEETPLQFHQLALFAAGARIRVVGDGAEFEQDRPNRQYYLAGNATTGIGFAVSSDTGDVTGFAYRAGRRTRIGGDILSGLEFRAMVEPEGGTSSCANEQFEMGHPMLPELEDSGALSMSAALAGEAITYQAVVAVDTDSEWLDGFGDDTASAATWIADLFLAMNVFYERDVETNLLIGDVILRTGADPYSEPNDRFAQLNEFGAYWKGNMGHVERQFATMLSGRNIDAHSFSGMAWLDQYCAYGRQSGQTTYGSYSFNAIGAAWSAGGAALYVGHELGHNMGSPHTHCYDPPVDNCYNAESNCFSGTPECPVGGSGTIMSYCHVSGSGGAGCGPSKSEFHPTVQVLLESRLASELVRGCIIPYQQVGVIFGSGFEGP